MKLTRNELVNDILSFTSLELILVRFQTGFTFVCVCFVFFVFDVRNLKSTPCFSFFKATSSTSAIPINVTFCSKTGIIACMELCKSRVLILNYWLDNWLPKCICGIYNAKMRLCFWSLIIFDLRIFWSLSIKPRATQLQKQKRKTISESGYLGSSDTKPIF